MKKKITAILMAAALDGGGTYGIACGVCGQQYRKRRNGKLHIQCGKQHGIGKERCEQQTDCKREHRECKAYGDAGCKNRKQQNREFEGKQLVCHV